MVNTETFMIGLLITSTLTGLVTEAIKKIATEHNKTYHANTLAGVVSMVMSGAIGVCYNVISNVGFTQQSIICIVALVFMSWLCAMVGYDKVIQSISQFKTTEKGE